MTRARNGAADNVEPGRWNLVGAQAGIVRVYNWRSDAESTCRRYNADPWLDAETPDPDAPYRVGARNARVAADGKTYRVDPDHPARLLPGAVKEARAARNGAAPAAPERAVQRERPEMLTTRLRPGYVARLRRLAEEDGYSVAEWIESWIEMAESEVAALRQRPSRRSI